MKKTYGYDLDKSVKCSNFVGATIDMAVELGFQKMLFTGHILYASFINRKYLSAVV